MLAYLSMCAEPCIPGSGQRWLPGVADYNSCRGQGLLLLLASVLVTNLMPPLGLPPRKLWKVGLPSLGHLATVFSFFLPPSFLFKKGKLLLV